MFAATQQGFPSLKDQGDEKDNGLLGLGLPKDQSNDKLEIGSQQINIQDQKASATATGFKQKEDAGKDTISLGGLGKPGRNKPAGSLSPRAVEKKPASAAGGRQNATNSASKKVLKPSDSLQIQNKETKVRPQSGQLSKP